MRRRRRRWRRCRWRAGRGTGGPGRSASSYAGPRGWPLLDVAQRNAGVQGGGDERVAESVRADPLGDAGEAGDAAHDPAGRMPFDSATAGFDEDRPLAPFPDGQIDRSGDAWRQWHRDDLGALAYHGQGAVAASWPSASMLAPIATTQQASPAGGFGDATSQPRAPLNDASMPFGRGHEVPRVVIRCTRSGAWDRVRSGLSVRVIRPSRAAGGRAARRRRLERDVSVRADWLCAQQATIQVAEARTAGPGRAIRRAVARIRGA